MAERLAITRQTVSKWELGESEPDIAYLVQLSDIFQVTTDHLIKDAPILPLTADSPNEKEQTLQGKAKIWVGGTFTMLGLLGVLAFWVLSIVRPVYTCHDGFPVNQSLFGGLQDFLLAWNAQGLFWFIVVIGAIGVVLLFFPNHWKGSAIDDAEKAFAKAKDDNQRLEKLLKDLKQHAK